MTATDDLRRMLTERGVGCVTDDGEYVKATTWYGVDDKKATFVEYANGQCRFAMDDYQITPQQAIAATLGAGTCHDKGGTDENGQQVFDCSECGCVLSLYDRDGTNTLCTGFIFDYPRYCPACGAKVVDE